MIHLGLRAHGVASSAGARRQVMDLARVGASSPATSIPQTPMASRARLNARGQWRAASAASLERLHVTGLEAIHADDPEDRKRFLIVFS